MKTCVVDKLIEYCDRIMSFQIIFMSCLNGNLSISKVYKMYLKTLENNHTYILLNLIKLFVYELFRNNSIQK